MKLTIKNDMIYEINDICVIAGRINIGAPHVQQQLHFRNYLSPSPIF
jgi:hypothetical protein